MMKLSQILTTVRKHIAELTVVDDASFKHYLQDKLGHLSHAVRSEMEPVLRKYRHVFHVKGSNDFRGTDLIEHK